MRLVFLIITTLASCFALPTKHSNLKIYGGKAAEPGQFPFIVAINATNFGKEWCAGTVIHENWVLTTARCSKEHDLTAEYLIVISATNRLDTDTGVVYNVSQIVIHPNWTEGMYSRRDDIALYQIDGSFTFSDLVQPVTLGDVFANDSVVLAGWGFTETTEDNPALQYAELTAWSNEDCRKEDGDIQPGQVCAFGGEGVGLCGGDEGAPLVLDGTLVGLGAGITSSKCGGGKPDIYTRVGYYKDWISDVIKS